LNGAYFTCGEEERLYIVLLGKSMGREPRCRWEDNIKMDLKEIE
jgi:hypothetical protein